MSVKILVVDNYDSFVYTLVGYLQQLGAQTTVVRNDDLDVPAATALAGEHQGVLLSPGPGAPADAGVCSDLILWAERTRTPLLGVCLGHQALGEVYGARVGHAQQLMHGKTSQLVHQGRASSPGSLHRSPPPGTTRSPWPRTPSRTAWRSPPPRTTGRWSWG